MKNHYLRIARTGRSFGILATLGGSTMIIIKMTFNGRLMMAAMFGAMLLFSAHDSKSQTTPAGPEKGYVKPVNAKEKFAFPTVENLKGELAKNAAELEALLGKVKVKKPRAEGKQPAARTRGNDATNWCGRAGYKGQCGIWQFDNFDFPKNDTTCGQAAAATIITHWLGQKNNQQFKTDVASYLYNNYGPNNVFGWFGTSWQQVVNSVIVPYKMGWRKVSGEADLRQELDRGIPVIVIVDSARLRERGYAYPKATVGIAAHYIVVYGYDSEYYFVTNHPDNWIRKADFLESWNTWIHEKIDGGNRGYVFWK